MIAITSSGDFTYGGGLGTGQYSTSERQLEGVCMAVPAVIWRNPKSIKRRRLWNKARSNGASTLFIVVRSGERETEWEGLPNLEVIDGGCQIARRRASLTIPRLAEGSAQP